MPRKKITKKKKKVGLALPPKYKSWRLLLWGFGFAAVGVLVVLIAFGDNEKAGFFKRKAGDLSISYVNEKPESGQLHDDGTITYLKRARSVDVAKDGTVYCTPEDSST